MTREDIQAGVKIGASAATILALLGGPLGFALYRLDVGVKDAATLCEVKWVTELTYQRHEQLRAYTTYVNAKLSLISIELGKDVRPESHRDEPLNADISRHQRESAWKDVQRRGALAQEAQEKAEQCPDYGGLIQ